MPKLAYTGLSHFREISKKDFSDNDIEHDAVKFSRKDVLRADNPKKIPNAVEVSQEVADFLLEVEPNDWKVVEEETEVADAGSPADPENTPDVTDNPAVDVGGVDTTSTTVTTGGSSTTPAARGGRR